jgi:hypothetical protein
MRITRLLITTALAVLGLVAFAAAQTDTTVYDATGSVSVKGGSKKKPKPGSLTFGFTVTDPSGNQPPPLQTYSIAFEGGRMNTNLVPACTAAKINAADGDDSICPAASKIGSGTLNAIIGSTGQPSNTKCDASLTLYGGGKGHATLMVRSELANCVTALHQAIDMQYFTKGPLAGLKFSVPDELRHQLGLDITVIKADTSIKKIVKTKKGKKVGFLESTGCSDGKRDLVVTFTDEQGADHPVTKTLGAC